MANATSKTPGRPASLPTPGTPLADYVIAYHAKHGAILSRGELAAMFGVEPSTATRWINGTRSMRGPAALRLKEIQNSI